MDKISDEIRNKLYRFAEELESNNIHINQLYLFGSHAQNNNNPMSDIDIAVVSEDFSGIRIFDYDKFIDAILNVDVSIEPIAYHPKDIQDDPFFIEEILNKGIQII
jgi:predicted nucleotidyltransferase